MRRIGAGHEVDSRRDTALILAARGLRALIVGFGAVLLGASLSAKGWPSSQVGLLLTATLGGTAFASIAVGMFGDRIGRRRVYALLYVVLAAAGAAFGLTDNFGILILAALTGTLSTQVIESGPFTSLEQTMLAAELDARARTRVFGTYNATATLVGSAGALLASTPALLQPVWPGVPSDQRLFLAFIPVGLACAALTLALSDRVEPGDEQARTCVPLRRSRPAVMALAGLFAVDAFAGGFVVQSFIAYWFSLRFGLSLEVLGVVFSASGLLQAASLLAAPRLAERIGLLNTMVFTHLPSNLLLAAIPVAPTWPVAMALLLARQSLSQMDVPTRQAYVIALVDPHERTATVAYTNTARYVGAPLAPVVAGMVQQVAVGLPFFLGGGIKIAYDLALWWRLRRVPLASEAPGLAGLQAAGGT